MSSVQSVKGYTATIGIECHVQLKTRTKLFSGADNDARTAAPNTLINHIDLGLPGALPVLNEAVIPLACRAAFALGARPEPYSKFDRKHYFYPDLPMGYQITQFDQPIILRGSVDISVDGVVKTIGITRAHLEADAGKSTHPVGTDYSLVDLNRAGTPLLEIVSEPDMHTAAEAKAYAKELYMRMKYAGVSDANLYYGNMRFDVNVSVSKTEQWGTRTETKNLNSFKSVEKAVEFEIARQISVLESGGEILQETRGWDDDKLQTFSQRSKEDAHDYRYFPDPDLPPIVLTEAYIADIEARMPKMPDAYRSLLTTIGIDMTVVEDVIAEPDIARLVEEVFEKGGPDHARRVVFWLLQDAADTSERGGHAIAAERLIALSQLVAAGSLSSTAAKQVYTELSQHDGSPEEIAKELNLIQESNEDAIATIVAKIISENPKAAADVAKGEMKAIGFLTGQVMKASQGKANPAMAQAIIKKQLGV